MPRCRRHAARWRRSPVVLWRPCRGSDAVAGHIPSLAARPLIGLGFSVGGMAAPVNLLVRALTPTFLLCVLCDRGPPTELGLGSPDQGAEIRAQ